MLRVLVFLMALTLLVVGNAFAALDLTGITVDTAPVFTLAAIIIAAIASIWAIKKVIKLGNRS